MAYYMLTNSIPSSCNDALDNINTTLPNISHTEIEYGDICNPYCITPLRQAALECDAIHDIYTAISSLCCYNHQRQRYVALCAIINILLSKIRCFSLAGHNALVTLINECHPTVIDYCSNTCSEAMVEASQVLGCCLPSLLTSYDSLLNTTLWQLCMVNDRQDDMCRECNVAMTTTGQVTVVILFTFIIIIFL